MVRSKRCLPPTVVGGYASWDVSQWDQCLDSIMRSVSHGVNVIYWFSIDLVTDQETKRPCIISRGPPKECLVRLRHMLLERGMQPIINLISIGGWNAKHPSTDNSTEQIYSAWKEWNETVMTDEANEFYGYDGIDWDVEGNDDLSSPFNHFSVKTLDLMGKMSQLAKKDGYIVSMAPMESYVDPTTSDFDRKVTFTNPEWQNTVPKFTYHGRNVYSYLLARYGRTSIQGPQPAAPEVEVSTFDIVILQLYESYSHANFDITISGTPASEALTTLVRKLHTGWTVKFSSDPDLGFGDAHVAVPPEQLVIGLANAWAAPAASAAPPHKFLFVPPADLRAGVEALRAARAEPRGFAFWTLVHEGDPAAGGAADSPPRPLFMAQELARLVAARDSE